MSTTRRPPEPRRRHSNLRDRYDLRGAVEPANGRAVAPRSRNAFTALVAVEDPHADPESGRKGRLIATVNRRVDILELERSHGRISDEAYCAGRLTQAIFEKARGPGDGVQWLERGARVDATLAKELAVIRALDHARIIQAHLGAMRRALGMIDASLIEAVLRDRMSYADLAAARGRAGDRGAAYFAQRFRDALEVLGEARGRP